MAATRKIDSRRAVPYVVTLAVWLFFFPLAATADDNWNVCFTPGSDCAGLIIDQIGLAKTSIMVQAYSFTSAPIAQALTDAHHRGVEVRVLLDKSQVSERYSTAKFFANAGIPVWIDDKVAIAHNKVMIIDGETVVTGSFNFTRSAQERNAENVLILRDVGLADKYIRNWGARQNVSRAYRPG